MMSHIKHKQLFFFLLYKLVSNKIFILAKNKKHETYFHYLFILSNFTICKGNKTVMPSYVMNLYGRNKFSKISLYYPEREKWFSQVLLLILAISSNWISFPINISNMTKRKYQFFFSKRFKYFLSFRFQRLILYTC